MVVEVGHNPGLCYNAGDFRRIVWQRIMAKDKKPGKGAATGRPGRVKLTAQESLKRMREFSKRKGAFVAAVRKGKNRSVPA